MTAAVIPRRLSLASSGDACAAPRSATQQWRSGSVCQDKRTAVACRACLHDDNAPSTSGSNNYPSSPLLLSRFVTKASWRHRAIRRARPLAAVLPVVEAWPQADDSEHPAQPRPSGPAWQQHRPTLPPSPNAGLGRPWEVQPPAHGAWRPAPSPAAAQAAAQVQPARKGEASILASTSLDPDVASDLEARIKAINSPGEVQQVLAFFQRTGRAPLTAPLLPGQTPPPTSHQQLPAQVYVLMSYQLSKVSMLSSTPAARELAEGTLQNLLKCLDAQLSSLSGYHLAILVVSIARLRYQPSEKWLQRFIEVSTPTLKDCAVPTLLSLVKAVGFIGPQPWHLKSVPGFKDWLDSLLACTRRQFAAFRGEELVRLLAALAHIKYLPLDEWMSDFHDALRPRLASLDASSLAKGIAAYAALKTNPEPQLLKAYYVQLYAKLPLFDDKELATTAEAFSVLRRAMKQEFLTEFLDEAVMKLPTFRLHTLSNLLRALGGIVCPGQQPQLDGPVAFKVPDQVVAALSAQVERVVWKLNGDGLSNCLWGLAALRHKPSEDFLDVCLEASLLRMHEMHSGQLTRMLQTLQAFNYQPRDQRMAGVLDKWYKQYIKLSGSRVYTPAHLSQLLMLFTKIPRHYLQSDVIDRLLRGSCLRGNPRNIGPSRVTMLGQALKLLGYRPGFFFTQLLAQVSRSHWTNFTPQEYADLMDSMSVLACPATADNLWISEFLVVIQCRLDHFPPSAMAKMLTAVARMRAVKPGPQWLALAVARIQQTCRDYSASDMCDVVLALSRFGYRPPPEVFDTFVQHVTANADTLPFERVADLSDALMAVMPGYLAGADGHEQYQALQMKLRAVEIPAAVLKQPVPEMRDGNGGLAGAGFGAAGFGASGDGVVGARGEASGTQGAKSSGGDSGSKGAKSGRSRRPAGTQSMGTAQRRLVTSRA